MFGLTKNSSVIITSAFCAFVGCSDEEPVVDMGVSSRDAGQADLGHASKDVGTIDMGTNDSDAGVADSGTQGPTVRKLVRRALFPAKEIRNFFFTPDFEVRLINGGWFPWPRANYPQDAPRVRLTRRFLPQTPGSRYEAIELAGKESNLGGTIAIGYAWAPAETFEASVWLASKSGPVATSTTIRVGLHGVDAQGQPVVLELAKEGGSKQNLVGYEWVRYSVRSPGNMLGQVSMEIENWSNFELIANSPHLGPAPQGRVIGGGIEQVKLGRWQKPPVPAPSWYARMPQLGPIPELKTPR